MIIATSGDDTQAAAATAAGADFFMPKPLSSVAEFQSTLLGLLPHTGHPPVAAAPARDVVEPDPIALKDDLLLAMDLLTTNPEGPTMAYLSGFLKGLTITADDPALADMGDAVGALDSAAAGMTTARRIADRIDAHLKVLAAA